MKQRGFTLIEMLVVIAIVGIMTAVVLGNQGVLSADMSLRSASDQIVLAFREAHVRGLAVSENPKRPHDFQKGYGVGVRSSEGEYQLALFIDDNDNGYYSVNNCVNSNNCPRKLSGILTKEICDTRWECLRVVDLPAGTHISEVEYRYSGTGSLNLLDSKNPNSSETAINVLFKRPRPTANILHGNGNSIDELVITVEHRSGKKLKIAFLPNADISITPVP